MNLVHLENCGFAKSRLKNPFKISSDFVLFPRAVYRMQFSSAGFSDRVTFFLNGERVFVSKPGYVLRRYILTTIEFSVLLVLLMQHCRLMRPQHCHVRKV